MPRAKGRLLPSSLSRSAAFGALPMRGKVLYPLIMANADDQGRILAEPQMLKWDVCPNVDDIGPDDVVEALRAMEQQDLIRVYDAGGVKALQLLHWWTDQASMQWAYPSDFAPPDGWNDRLRFRQAGQVITINWPGKTDGSQAKPLAELQLTLGRSLEVAVKKSLGELNPNPSANVSPSPLGNGYPNPSANGNPSPLPEPDKRKGKGVVEEEQETSVPSAEVTGSSEPPDTSDDPPGLSPPVFYRDWAALLERAENGRDAIGTLADFARAQYPADVQGGTPAPTLQAIASNIGGILRTNNLDPVDLLKIMWRATSNVPEGDFLAYVRGVVKRQEAANGGEQRAAGDGAGDWSGLPVDAAEEPAAGDT